MTDGDLISRDYVLSKFKEQCDICGKYKENNGVMCNCCALDDAIDYVEDAPSAEKTAEWIKQKSGDELFPEEIVCSKCYHSNSHLDFDEHNNPIGKLFLESKYCPNCGAKMDKS